MQLLLKSMEADVCCRIFRKTWFLTNEKKVNASLNVAALHKIAPPDSTGAVLSEHQDRGRLHRLSPSFITSSHTSNSESLKYVNTCLFMNAVRKNWSIFRGLCFFFFLCLDPDSLFHKTFIGIEDVVMLLFFLQATKQMIEFAYIFHTCVLWDMQGVDLCRAH